MPSFTRNINIISRCAHAYRADSLAGQDLGPSYYFYVLLICAQPGISQDQLARRLYINKSSVTRAIVSLEENGFAERRIDDADKRIARIYPTQKALDILPEVRRIARGWNDFLLSDLEENEMQQFLATLEKVTAKAQSYIDLNLDAKELQKP